MREKRVFQHICQDFARLGTTIVADALGKTGGVPGVCPIVGNQRSVAGPIWYVEAYRQSNWPVHEALREVPKGSFVFVEGWDVMDRAIFGCLVTTYLWKKREAVGIAVNGAMRDMQDLVKLQAPVWCKSASPIGCFHTNVPPLDAGERQAFEEEARRSYGDPRGGIAVADASGVVIVPEDQIEATHARALEVECQEKRWFAALEQGKNTFEIVCFGKDERQEL